MEEMQAAAPNIYENIKRFRELKNISRQQMAADLDYVPMPDVTTDFIRKNVFSKVVIK